MLNHVTITGQLVADPELRTGESGAQTCVFRIASESDVTSKKGTKKVAYLQIVAWKDAVKRICSQLTKGSLVTIEGSLESYSYTDKDGIKHYGVQIVAERACQGEHTPQEGPEPQREAAPDGGSCGLEPWRLFGVPENFAVPAVEEYENEMEAGILPF